MFGAITDDTCFLILKFLLLAYRNIIDFCVLILYDTILKSSVGMVNYINFKNRTRLFKIYVIDMFPEVIASYKNEPES